MWVYYVYHLIDPRTDLPRYVGKGSDTRISEHTLIVENGRKHYNTHLHNWISKLFRLGLRPIEFKVFEIDDEQAAYDMEKEEIARIGLDKLCNLTEGGLGGLSGFTHSEETRSKISESSKGKIIPIEARRNMSEAHLGQIVSDECKEKLRFANTGKKIHSNEYKDNLCERMKGNTYRVGTNHSEETKKKIRNSNLGQKRSEQARQNMRDAAKRRLAKLNAN